MGNSINNQFKMRRHGGAVERATETSGTPYSEAQGRTMAQMGMVDSGVNMGHSPTNYGTTPIKNTGGKKPKKDEFGTIIPEDSDTGGRGGVTGTTYTKDTTEIASDFKRGNKPAQVGQTTSDPSFEEGDRPEVIDTFRDKRGNKASGTSGDIKVRIKKGSTRFS